VKFEDVIIPAHNNRQEDEEEEEQEEEEEGQEEEEVDQTATAHRALKKPVSRRKSNDFDFRLSKVIATKTACSASIMLDMGRYLMSMIVSMIFIIN
jgi:hypothetical protein